MSQSDHDHAAANATETLTAALPDAVEQAVLAVLARIRDEGWSVATAESCTGGLVASALTDVPGCSGQFERGFVTYSEQAKIDMLGVPGAVIARDTAVSEAVARAMAVGAIERSRADIAVAITGYAGPTGDDGEEGLVHFAAARRGGAVLHACEHFGTIGRGPVRTESLRRAVELLDQLMDRCAGQR